MKSRRRPSARRPTRRNPEWSWSLLDLIWTRLRKLCNDPDLMPIESRGALVAARAERPGVAPWNRSSVRTPSRGNPRVEEHGSGHYGVVMPTRNPKWVFKITRDQSEAKFWNLLRRARKRCTIEGIARCSPVYRVPIKLQGMEPWRSTAYVLWREAADVAGGAVWPALAERGRETMSKQAVQRLLQSLDLLRTSPAEAHASAAYGNYLQNPILAATGVDLLELFALTGVVVSDLHLNNWGIVPRRPRKATLLDPGEVVFTDPAWDIEPPTL